MSANTDIADESIFQTCLKGRDGRKKEKRQSNHRDVSQREKETCINACGASNLQLL
jgi:hypothetical protein